MQDGGIVPVRRFALLALSNQLSFLDLIWSDHVDHVPCIRAGLGQFGLMTLFLIQDQKAVYWNQTVDSLFIISHILRVSILNQGAL